MVVLDKNALAPATPPSDWGVVERKLTMRDFAFTFKAFACTLVCLVLILTPGLADFKVGQSSVREFGIYLGIISALATLFSAWGASGNPHSEAVRECNRRSHQWQNDVLIPFLERRYGVSFEPYSDLFGLGYEGATYQGRTIQVRLSGVEDYFNYKFGPDDFFRSFVVRPDQIRLEEVIRPESISFKPIPSL